MVRGNRRMLIIAGVVLVVSACSAALALRRTNANKAAQAGLAKVVPRSAARAASEEPESVPERSFDDYRVVTQRNIFKPLLSPPQANVALAVPAGIPSPTGPSRSQRGGGPSGRSDPTADLTMTGVVESASGLKALITHIRTGDSVYVGVGESAFGLRVAAIEAKRVVLTQGDRTYSVAMGAKEVAQGGTGTRPGGSTEGAATAPSGASSGATGGPPSGFSGRSGFGPPGMSREEMMRRFSQMSEEERSRYRDSRFGGGRGGPGGGSFGGRGSGGGRGPGGRGG